MTRDELKASQPVAWQVLSKALKKSRPAHAYLFYGPKSAPKKEMGLLLAQSLFCTHPDEEGFACQECEECRRVEKEESLDFYWLHEGGLRSGKAMTRKELDNWWKSGGQDVPDKKVKGSWHIVKDDILAVQDAFSTPARSGDYQVYIMEDYDRVTPEASNSLLKFLEEPQPGIIGILEADDINRVLDTIQSRCQLIPFRPVPARLESLYASQIEDPFMASLLAREGYEQSRVDAFIEQPLFASLHGLAKSYWQDRKSHTAILELQQTLFASRKNALSRELCVLFLQIIAALAREDHSLNDSQHAAVLQLCLDYQERLARPVDPALCLDGFFWQIMQI